MKNIRLIFVFLILFGSMFSGANAADYRFGELTNADCRPSRLYPGCQVDASGFVDPVVFLMPTIDQSELDRDLPATLRTLGRSGSTFYVVQDTAPESMNSSYKSNPMTDIQYLIVENGKTIRFDGGAFYANKVYTDKQIRSGYTYDIDAHNYPWHEFPRLFDDKNNVVITELQSAQYNAQYKPLYWLTSDPIHIEDDGFHSGLERTELGYTYSFSQPLAYLVGYGEGYLEGDNYISFSKGNSYQPMRWGNSYIEDSCQHEIDLGTTFDSEPYLFTRSQWRLGSVGGWTRHCKGTKSSVFVAIEDMLYSDGFRKNNYQPTGTLAYGTKVREIVPPIDHCQYFPQPAQSWEDDSKVTINEIKNGVGLYPDFYISGWSDGYVQENLELCESSGDVHNCDNADVVNKLNIPFEELVDWSNFNSCDVGTCEADNDEGMIDSPEEVDIEFSSRLRVVIDNDDFDEDCGSGSKCNAYIDPSDSDHIIVEVTKDLESLTVHDPSPKRMTVRFQPNRRVETYTLNTGLGDVTTHFSTGVYYFNSVGFSSTNLTLSHDQNVALLFAGNGSGLHFTNQVHLVQPSTNDSLLIYAPEGSIRLNAASNAEEIKVLALAESITLDANTYIRGAVTTNNLIMNAATTAVVGDSSCFNPEPISLELKITPLTSSGIACDGIPIDFSLVNSTTGKVVDGSGQSLFVESSPISGSNYACWSSDGDMPTSLCKKDHDYTAQFPTGAPATVRGYIHSKFLNDYNIVASVNDENLSESAGPYEFLAQSVSIVPSNGVDGEDFYQVAGREFPFRLKIRGTQGSGNQLNCKVIDVDGAVDVDFSTIQLPSESPHPLQISQSGGNWQNANTTLSIVFDEGVAGGSESSADGSLRLKLDDAGIVDFTASGNSGRQSLTTTERLYFRPFALPICAQSSALPDNTDEISGGYAAAGTDVSVYVRPVNWSVGLDSNNDGIPNGGVTATNLCVLPQTESFYTHSGYAAVASFSQEATLYPGSGALGSLTLAGQTLDELDVEIVESSRFSPYALNWNEVGTVSFSAVQNNYFNRANFNVPQTTTNIGRFYPDYFNTLNNDWVNPVGQTFTYMNQEFENVTAEVAAYSALGNETLNYGNFEPIQRAFFSLDEGRLLNGDSGPIGLNSSYVGSRWQLNSSNISWQKLTDFSPDGPFNFAGGEARNVSLNIFTATLSDPVQFKTAPTDPDDVVTQVLPDEQPSVVFGRVNLSDVGGVEGSDINVPLQVQYWTDGAFINNEFDSFTEVDAEVDGTPTVIWPAGGTTTVGLTGSADVVQGVANGLIASQNVETREQVEILQQLNSATNSMPWLMFDWDQDGVDEENPSTIVTFGIHRGNDRVIFRGEPGL